MGMLYEKCPICKAGAVEPELRLKGGNCPGCDGKLFVETGLTVRQLRNIEAGLKRYVSASVGRDSAFETGHYYHGKFKDNDLCLLVERVFSAIAGGSEVR